MDFKMNKIRRQLQLAQNTLSEEELRRGRACCQMIPVYEYLKSEAQEALLATHYQVYEQSGLWLHTLDMDEVTDALRQWEI